MPQLVAWALDMQRYALPFLAVERVVRAVEVTSLPGAPELVCGIVNVRGQVVPVMDMRRRFHLAQREIALSDLLVLARTARRTVAFFADTVSSVADYPEDAIVTVDALSTDAGCIAGIAKMADGMILIHDLDLFLSAAEESALDGALASTGEKTQ